MCSVCRSPRASARCWSARCGCHRSASARRAALLLGPLTVEPPFRERGIGTALVQRALDEAKAKGHRLVVLVGDEPYLRQVGFKRIPKGHVKMPGPVDPARLLVAELAAGAFDGVSGSIRPDWENSSNLAAFSRPRRRQRADQQQQAEQAGEHRQHADAAHHAGVAHLQADPVVALEGVARCAPATTRGTLHADRRRRAGARRRRSHCSIGAQHLGRRGHFGEFARIGRADIDQRRQLAVGRAPQAELVGRRRGAPQPGLAGGSVNRARLAGRRGRASPG